MNTGVAFGALHVLVRSEIGYMIKLSASSKSTQFPEM